MTRTEFSKKKKDKNYNYGRKGINIISKFVFHSLYFEIKKIKRNISLIIIQFDGEMFQQTQIILYINRRYNFQNFTIFHRMCNRINFLNGVINKKRIFKG